MKGIFPVGFLAFLMMIFFLVCGVFAIYVTSLCGRLIGWSRLLREQEA